MSIWGVLIPLVIAASTQTLLVSDVPTTLDENGEAEITINFSCPSCSTDSYVRGVFYPSGTSYFGYTQNNEGTWTNAPGGSCTQYYKVLQTDLSKEGTWSGRLKFRPDRENSYYNGPGEYLFKVGRYTPSCSSASVWSSETTIAITGPTHTPTPEPSPTAAPTNTPNPTSTNTPVVPTPTSTIKPSPTPTETEMPLPTDVFIPDILGEQSVSDQAEENIATVGGQKSGVSPFVISFLCIGIGLALLATALAWKKTDVWKKLVDH